MVRHRYVGDGMREELKIRNPRAPAAMVVTLAEGADFADLYEVKADTHGRRRGPDRRCGLGLTFDARGERAATGS